MSLVISSATSREDMKDGEGEYHGNINIPIGSMYGIYIYMVIFTINTPQMLAYIPYMDPMGYIMRI